MSLSAQLLEHEAGFRFACFLTVLLILTIWELIWPRRTLQGTKSNRWATNFGLAFIDTVTLKVLMPFLAVEAAVQVQTLQWGIFNWVSFPFWASFILSILLLDLTIYWQHRLFHVIPLFWRFHRVHHTDIGFDVSTGIRFHPIEIVISMVIKIGAVFIIGPSVLAVVAFEVLLNATSLFNHGNIKLPEKVEPILRWFVVTPDMHRIHHSVIGRETNSNYCFNFPWWDKIFKSYCHAPHNPQTTMDIGLTEYKNVNELKFTNLLQIPFKK
jgi:sterol desaturase/sphingolipid hydroxylase (fatty acid hydroxylase superfamily)